LPIVSQDLPISHGRFYFVSLSLANIFIKKRSQGELYMKDSTESIRLDRFEFLAMNNPLRRWRWKRWEFPLFLRMLQMHEIELSGKVVMDMGCGSGFGTELIIKELKPSQVIAFDLMPEQIKLAKRRELHVDFKVGDATAMDAPDSSCNAVFDFGVLHHIPLWRKALDEAARVLVSDGVLLIEEPHKMFEWPEFELGIQQAGLKILERRQWYGGFFRFFLTQKN
jgi:SAM-dependent methyltransferase